MVAATRPSGRRGGAEDRQQHQGGEPGTRTHGGGGAHHAAEREMSSGMTLGPRTYWPRPPRTRARRGFSALDRAGPRRKTTATSPAAAGHFLSGCPGTSAPSGRKRIGCLECSVARSATGSLPPVRRCHGSWWPPGPAPTPSAPTPSGSESGRIDNTDGSTATTPAVSAGRSPARRAHAPIAPAMGSVPAPRPGTLRAPGRRKGEPANRDVKKGRGIAPLPSSIDHSGMFADTYSWGPNGKFGIPAPPPASGAFFSSFALMRSARLRAICL